MIGVAVAGEVRAHGAAIERDLRAAAAQASADLGHDDEEAREHEGRREHHAEREEHERRPAAGGVLVFSARAGDGVVVRGGAALPTTDVPDEPALARALEGAETWSDRAAGGEPLRVYSAPARKGGRVIGAVQVAVPIAADRLVLSRSIVILLATGGGGLVAALLGSAFLAGRAMKPIEDAFERQRRFLADASHELRTPVAVVRARSELLAQEAGALPAAARDELRRLERDASELAVLLDELLDLSRLDAGQAELASEPVPLADVVEEIAAQLGPLAAERGVTLRATASPVWARADLARVRQVLRALVDNALKHTGDGGSVRLAAAREGDFARVDVADDGEGISPEHLPRVLDRFYRADAARARGRGGAGLGLAIASELTRRMNGTMRLDSEVGRGTTATIRLPAADG
jgi:signal transduction histidine kinase